MSRCRDLDATLGGWQGDTGLQGLLSEEEEEDAEFQPDLEHLDSEQEDDEDDDEEEQGGPPGKRRKYPTRRRRAAAAGAAPPQPVGWADGGVAVAAAAVYQAGTRKETVERAHSMTRTRHANCRRLLLRLLPHLLR